MTKNKKNKLPILMYHEVTTNDRLKDLNHKMTPSYFLFKDTYASQIEIIREKEYQPNIFENLLDNNIGPNNIFITFDDGWSGNYYNAVPILNDCGFKATIFTTVELIDRPGYMSWNELNDLILQGMSIQSHCMTHRPLQTLDKVEIFNELSDSKKIIEDKLGKEVMAISFPHGSYNSKIIDMASEIGYKIMCTSNLKYNHPSHFNKTPLVLGRITITNNISPDKFAKLIAYDPYETYKAIIFKKTKNFIKRIIGIENYRKLYRKYYNIEQG